MLARARAAFAAAIMAGDARAAAAAYARDALLLAPAAQPIRGPGAIEAFWRTGVEVGITRLELVPSRLLQDGRLACEFGRYELRLEPAEGTSVVDRGHYLLVHARQDDGSWCRAIELLSPDAPAPPLPPPPAGPRDGGALQRICNAHGPSSMAMSDSPIPTRGEGGSGR